MMAGCSSLMFGRVGPNWTFFRTGGRARCELPGAFRTNAAQQVKDEINGVMCWYGGYLSIDRAGAHHSHLIITTFSIHSPPSIHHPRPYYSLAEHHLENSKASP